MQIISNLYPSFNDSLLKDIEEHSKLQEFKAGDIIMRSGQYIRNTLLVLKGKIKVYREDDDGGEFFMYYLMPGQACAISMICAVQSKQSEIMARVVEDTEVLMIPLQLMDQWMLKHRSWYEFVIATYRFRFEEVLTLIDSIAFRAMDERLEFYLKRQRDSFNSNELPISHQEIANDLNTSREVISRLLKKMEQRGILKLNRNIISMQK